jgi:hypothetical protein
VIKELEQELIVLVKGVPSFASSGFSIFSLTDLEAQGGATINYPIAGVGYNGTEPAQGNQADPKTTSHSAQLVNATFLVVVGVQYGAAGQDDTKPTAFDLLDQVRAVVSGYKGVNLRPWRFIGERPEQSASEDGVVFYSQVWQTAFVSSGTFNNS